MREQQPSPAVAAVIARLRDDVAGPGVDRFLSPEIEATVQLVADGTLLDVAHQVCPMQ